MTPEEQVDISLAEQNTNLQQLAGFHKGEAQILRQMIYRGTPNSKQLMAWAKDVENQLGKEHPLLTWVYGFAAKMQNLDRFYREIGKAF